MALNLKRREKSTEFAEAKADAITVSDQSLVVNSVVKLRERNSDETLKRKLKAYHQINELFQDKGHNLGQLTRDFLDLAVEVLDAGGGSLWMLEKGAGALTCKVATGPGSQGLPGVTVPIGKGVVGWVGEKQRGTLVKNTATDERFKSNESNEKQALATQSILASPLIYRGQILGVVEIVDRKLGGEFSQADLSFLNSICVPAALNLHTAETLQNQRELIGRLDAMKSLQEAFGSTMDLEPLLTLVLSRALELMSAEVGSIWLVEDSGEGIECRVAEGPTKDKVIGVKIKRGQGIIGFVVDSHKPEIVADCSRDVRFSGALDKKIGFETRSMISAPLCVKGECIGAIQIINKRDRQQLFSDGDLDFLLLFAGNAAMYIKNARLFSAEKKAKELSALLKISGEITSTLDIDAVLMSVVNLSSDVIPYDRAVISIAKKHSDGQFVVRAISGLERIDQESSEARTLTSLHEICAQQKDGILVQSKGELEREGMPPAVKAYMEAKGLESFWVTVLKDDQGVLGVISIESATPNLVSPGKLELLTLLVNQSIVALRNADLYSAIPNTMGVGSIKARFIDFWSSIRAWTPVRHAIVWGGVLLAGCALVFIKAPHSISAAVEIVPMTSTYYAETQGKVEEVLVKEGETVNKGQVLVRLDASEARIKRDEKLAARLKIKAEMIRLLNDDKVADAKIKEQESNSLGLEIHRLEMQITKADVRSQFEGVIVSENLRDLLGKPMSVGQELIRVARLDRMIAEFKVPEEDVTYVRPGQEIKFKVFGYPATTFGEGVRLISVAGEGLPLTEAAPEKFFVARAEVSSILQDEGGTGSKTIRPGMTGRGKISADAQPLWYVIMEKPLRFILNKLLF